MPADERERRRQRAKDQTLIAHVKKRPPKKPWTLDELQQLGTEPDDVLAQRFGRTVNAVRIMRVKREALAARMRRGSTPAPVASHRSPSTANADTCLVLLDARHISLPRVQDTSEDATRGCSMCRGLRTRRLWFFLRRSSAVYSADAFLPASNEGKTQRWRLRLSRHLHFFGLLRRFPIADPPNFGPEHALRFAEILLQCGNEGAVPEQRVRLLAERALIEELAGRTEGAIRSYSAALSQAAAHAPDLLPELRYQEAKFRLHCSNYKGAQSELEGLILDPAASALLRRRAYLQLGRVALEQGRYADAIDALMQGLDGQNTESNLVSGSLDLAYAHIHQNAPTAASMVLNQVQEMITPSDRIARTAIQYYSGWLELIQSHLAAARSWFESARDQALDSSMLNAQLCAELALSYPRIS